jgi:glucose/arabinose dehydrogenase
MKGIRFSLPLGFFLLFLPFQAGAQFPAISLAKQISGLSFPVHITHAGDGSGRLFIVEQPGRIRIVKAGVLLAAPFLDISNSGVNRVLFGGEQGLLSVAFPPQYSAKGYFYVYYTNLNGDNVVARYFLTANPDVADPGSEVILQTFSHPVFTNHNGGQLAFGPDGFLYIGTGDGGSGGDPNNNGQNPGTFLGKILRIDVESVANPRNETYVIPPSNPFVATQGFLPEIWALGLRNPFRFSFDRLTGDLYIGDVGQNLFEEIDFQAAASPGGENYGWSIMEGFQCFNKLDFNNPLPTCNQAGLTLPVAEYDHGQGDCAVIGGFAYRGNLHPQMKGFYFYGDECTGRIRALKRNGGVWQNSLLLDSPLTIASYGEDEAGELYLADYATGDIYRMAGPVAGDFDGDGKADIVVYRGTNGGWYVIPSGGAAPYGVVWGGDATDKPAPGDYDGDGKTDIAVYRASNGGWYIIPSSGAAPYGVGWGGDATYGVSWGGGASDQPVPGDFDGDGKTDVAIYRSSNGGWYIIPSSPPSTPYGAGWGGGASDIPVPGEYDGDGKTDVAIYRPSNGGWYIIPSGGAAPYGVAWGGSIGDLPVRGDYDGDGKTDIAVYRASNGGWYVMPSSGAAPYGVGWGGDLSDKPVPGDYDGDGKTDIAVYRKSNGGWYVIPSSGAVPYGVGWGGDPSDVPITK